MDPLALLIVGTGMWGAYECCRWLWQEYALQGFKNELEDRVARENGNTLGQQARRTRQGLPFFLVAPTIAIILILLAGDFPSKGTLIALGMFTFVGSFVRPENEYVAMHYRYEDAHKREQHRQARPIPNPFSGFGSKADDDDGFFARRDPPRSKARPDPKPAPRGYEKRHPDDAKLWAVVDDPAATDNERRSALEAILKREARRGANRHEAANDVLKLLGYSA